MPSCGARTSGQGDSLDTPGATGGAPSVRLVPRSRAEDDKIGPRPPVLVDSGDSRGDGHSTPKAQEHRFVLIRPDPVREPLSLSTILVLPL
eukprot:scaffold1861_cov111-Isochrysis_galbana.AAC.8